MEKEGFTLKMLATKREPKNQRESKVLLGLVELYIETGKPIGSNTLKEAGFEDLSSATIRNYYSKLEKEGYLQQQHSSGGRIPTAKAFKKYAETYFHNGSLWEEDERRLKELLRKDTKEIAEYLHMASQLLSDITKCPVILSAPRLEMDFVQAVKLLPLSPRKILAVIVTDYGAIRTETFYPPKAFTIEELLKMEEFIYWKLNKGEKPSFTEEILSKWAQRIYSELMVRHLIASSSKPMHFTGVSKLLGYPEFAVSSLLAEGLSFFENQKSLESLLDLCVKKNDLCLWIGEELKSHELSAIAIPYYIGHTPVGALALLGPMRLDYRRLFGILRILSSYISETLSQSVYKYKIAFHKPNQVNPSILLENKGNFL